MSSAFAAFPPSLADGTAPDRSHAPRNLPPHTHQQQQQHNANHLSPYSSTHANSGSASPTLNTGTPADSVTSVHYQSSDYSDIIEDPYFGVDFSAAEGNSPSFLEHEQFPPSEQTGQFVPDLSYSTPDQTHDAPKVGAYQHRHPISPDQTPSLNNNTSPYGERRGAAPTSYFGRLPQADSAHLPQSVSPQELTRQFQPIPVSADAAQSTYQLTPVTSGSGQSSDDGLAPAPPVMPCQSPRVTVSAWESYRDSDVQTPSAALETAPDALTSNAATNYGGEQHAHPSATTAGPVARDEEGRWLSHAAAGPQGIDPDNRPSTDLSSSMNDDAARRKVEARNQEVREWLSDSSNQATPVDNPQMTHPDEHDNIPEREIPLGSGTENKHLPGQTYFPESGAGEVTSEDINIMRANRNWADGPVLHRIQGDGVKHQPDSSQAAIEKFERMCRDNDSVVSRAATWGTRRRSLPSVHDFEGVTSGNFLKKLSLNRGENRRPSILGAARQLLRKPSTSFKRNRASEETPEESPPRDSRDSLAPPTSSSSGGFGKRQPVPSINTTLVSMTSSVAAVGATTHVRGGSFSRSSITSPKSPSLSLGVKEFVNRRRSGSELVGMWKKSGGPPVAVLANPPSATTVPASAAPDQDDDDDEDDDTFDDQEMGGGDKAMDDINPTMAGFREHLLKLNPGLATENNYLVDRIAHQQTVRYKNLLNARVKHLKQTSTRTCPCSSMCIAQGGTARALDSRGPATEPLSARYDGSDENTTPRETLTQDIFPPDIPMPPTGTLPAEFECQLCFQAKKFQKPSDWTKHVHEDVQPFTCTWERCRDPKIFKRKADWVRHENEGHRHLEWWRCDVDGCGHICYRRDNFLQHLVREHKFLEPKVKTKAAIKKAAAPDPTWQMVEKCHQETLTRPQEEPCRFCGRTFQSWKKLTVHLAKHMESVSLPVLRLVARAELDTDTIISPVQDPPPRSFQSFTTEQETPMFNQQAQMRHASTMNMAPNSMPYQAPQAFAYNNMAPQLASVPQVPSTLPSAQFNPTFYGQTTPQFSTLGQNLDPSSMGLQVGGLGFGGGAGPHGYSNMPVATDTYIAQQNPFSSVSPDVEPFPAMDMNALGLQGLQDTTGSQGAYDNLMTSTTTGAEQYGHQGNVSPFSHSPNPGNQGQGGFYDHGQ